MAHIPDGVLSLPVLAAGAAVSLAGCAIGLRRLEPERIPTIAVLSSVCFVASLVHFPVGPSSVHLLLNGLAGIVLGSAAFPAIAVALLLQAALFGFGGVIALGVNIMNMAVPALLCGVVFAAARRRDDHRLTTLAAGVAGALGVLLTALMVAGSLALSGRAFVAAAQMVVLAHLPVMVIEAVFTAAAVGLLLRVKPGFLAGWACVALVSLVCLTAAPAQAHKLRAFAMAEGPVISGYAYFSTGSRAGGATVTVTEGGGAPVATLTTDDAGAFRFEARRRVDHVIEVDAGDGHLTTIILAGAELPETLPGGDRAVAPPPAAALPATASADADLRAFIDRSVARQIRPLREQLDAYQDKVWWHDVMGGLGTIAGLAGFAYGLTARRKPEAPS